MKPFPLFVFQVGQELTIFHAGHERIRSVGLGTVAAKTATTSPEWKVLRFRGDHQSIPVKLFRYR